MATLTLTLALRHFSRHSTEIQLSEHVHGTGREKSLFEYQHPRQLDAGEWVARIRPPPRTTPSAQPDPRGTQPDAAEGIKDEPIAIRFPVAAVHPVSDTRATGAVQWRWLLVFVVVDLLLW